MNNRALPLYIDSTTLLGTTLGHSADTRSISLPVRYVKGVLSPKRYKNIIKGMSSHDVAGKGYYV